MKTRNIVLVILIILISGVVVFYVKNSSLEEDYLNQEEVLDVVVGDSGVVDSENLSLDSDQSSPLFPKGPAESAFADPAALSSSGYIDYSTETFIANNVEKKVLFFHASWCPTCRTVEKSILNNENSIPANVAIFKVNYDRYKDLRKKYNVQYQHTFVQVDNEGNGLNTFSGSVSLDSILRQIQ